MLNSLRFCSQGQVDAYRFPQEENSNFIITWDFSEEYGERASSIIVSRESTPPLLATSISEFDDEDDAHTTTPQNDAEELEDEVIHRCKPEQWVDYSESEDVELRTSLLQSASDVGDETFSPDLLKFSTIYECDEEVDDEQQEDKPVEAQSLEPRQLSPLYQSLPEFADGERDDGLLEADSPEPEQLSTLHQSHPAEMDDDQQDDQSVDSNSPEPQRLFPFHPPEFEIQRRSAQQMETFCPGPLRRFLTPDSILRLDAFEEWFVYMSELGSVDAAAFSPERFHSETPSPEPRRLFPVHQFHSTVYAPPQPAPERETGIFCPKQIRQYPTHRVILQPELFEDWYVDMSEPVFVEEAIISTEQHSQVPRPEVQNVFPVAHKSKWSEFDDMEKNDDKLLEANISLQARRHFQVDQFHSPLYGSPHAVSESDDEASESMEYISLQNLNLGF